MRPDGVSTEVWATHVLLATGGAGQLYAVTTNPAESTGDGVAMALRAHVAVADVEFMQFHPTALHIPEMPRPLLTEALRGHGAYLRGPDGERFVDELLPRDVVSRAEMAVMLDKGVDHVLLDATGLDAFGTRFPNIAAELDRLGLDPAVDLLPVAPAAHYLSGGLVTDLRGATSLPGLWAAGEVACTGVHGANRLASNSLLEGLVFGPRVVEAIVAGVTEPTATGSMRAVIAADAGRVASDAGEPGSDPILGVTLQRPDEPEACDASLNSPAVTSEDFAEMRLRLQRDMTLHAGVLRSAESLGRVAQAVEAIQAEVGAPTSPAAWEILNLCTTGRALVAAARCRTESRGAHTRNDFPEVDPEQRVRLVQR